MFSERKSTTVIKKLFTIFISLIILVIQLAFYFIVFFGINGLKKEYYQIYNWVYVCFQILGIGIVFSLYNKKINNSYKLTWIIFILLAPFFGTMWYLLFGNGRRIPKRKNKKIDAYLENRVIKNSLLDELKEKDIIAYKHAKVINSSTKFPIFKNTKTFFFNDALNKHKEMLEDIKKANKYIFLEYFIVADGYLLNQLVNILEEKGNNGIEIKIIYDDIGSRSVLSKETIARLKKIPNLKMCSYEPLGININPAINYRDHRKMTIIDGKVAYCGGDNLADEYIHERVRFGFWRDNAIRLEGQAVNSFIVLFASMWYMSSKEMLDVNGYFITHEVIKDSFVMPFGDGPTNMNNPGYELFISMISNAKKSISISTPYFIIDQNFIEALVRACLSGVDVRILVPHIPDKKMVFMLTRAHYGEILKAGGKIYEYSLGFNHAKNVIIDEAYAFIGTINMDYRSLFLHFECGVLLIKDSQIKEMAIDYDNAIGESEEIIYEKWKNRSIFVKMFEFILSVLAPLV